MCRREGEYWSIAFAGQGFRLKDVKGLHYLAYLLRNPGREFHVLDLAAAGQGVPAGGPRISPARDDDLRPARLSDTGPVLDEQAKTAYRARLRELEEELAEATSWADPVRAARARQEMQFLADELAAAVGLGGRDRTSRIPGRAGPGEHHPGHQDRPGTHPRPQPRPRRSPRCDHPHRDVLLLRARSASPDHLAHLTAGVSFPFIAGEQPFPARLRLPSERA